MAWVVFTRPIQLTWIAGILCLGILVVPSLGQNKEPIKSGPEKGVHILYALHINSRSAGWEELVTYDLPVKGGPSIFIFSQTTSEPFMELIRKLDKEAGRANIFLSVIFFPRSEELVDRLKGLVKKEKLPNTLLFAAKGSEGFGGWKIAKEAEITVLLYPSQRRWLINFAFRKGEFDSKAMEMIMKKVPTIYRKEGQ